MYLPCGSLARKAVPGILQYLFGRVWGGGHPDGKRCVAPLLRTTYPSGRRQQGPYLSSLSAIWTSGPVTLFCGVAPSRFRPTGSNPTADSSTHHMPPLAKGVPSGPPSHSVVANLPHHSQRPAGGTTCWTAAASSCGTARPPATQATAATAATTLACAPSPVSNHHAYRLSHPMLCSATDRHEHAHAPTHRATHTHLHTSSGTGATHQTPTAAVRQPPTQHTLTVVTSTDSHSQPRRVRAPLCTPARRRRTHTCPAGGPRR